MIRDARATINGLKHVFRSYDTLSFLYTVTRCVHGCNN